MLFGSSMLQAVIDVPYSTVWRNHIYQFDSAGKVVWPPTEGPIPSAWPKPIAGNDKVTGFYTLYPNPDNLLAGKLDAQIRAMLSTAPPKSLLTTFAEADGGWSTGGQWAPAGITRDALHQVHAKMHSLAQGTNVQYGIVNCGYGAGNAAFAIPGMDFYGLDIYEPCKPGLFNALNTWRQTISAVQPNPTLCIAECNSSNPARRPFWFAGIFGWLKCYEKGYGKVAAMCTYYNPGGKLSGPWQPQDAATMATLSGIAWAAP